MTNEVKFFHPPNSLGDAMKKKGGITASDAVARAERNLDAIRDNCLRVLDGKIAEIERLAGQPPAVPGKDDVKQIYSLGNEILGEAGALGLMEMSAVGRSLCELISLLEGVEKVDTRMIRVHIDAMKSLRRPEVRGDPKVRAAVLRGLQQLTSKVSATGASSPN